MSSKGGLTKARSRSRFTITIHDHDSRSRFTITIHDHGRSSFPSCARQRWKKKSSDEPVHIQNSEPKQAVTATLIIIVTEGHQTAFNSIWYQFTTGKPSKNLKLTLNYYENNGCMVRLQASGFMDELILHTCGHEGPSHRQNGRVQCTADVNMAGLAVLPFSGSEMAFNGF